MTSASLDRTFDVIAPIELATVFHGFGPLPSVANTRDHTGDWDDVGQSRILELGDGSEATETITLYERPTHFAYRVDAFTGSLRRLITHVDGEWWFEPAGEGRTHIRWTYAFVPRSTATRAAVRSTIAPLWRAYAKRTLARMLEIVEQVPGAAPSSPA